MLGGKYIIVPGRYPDARLTPVAQDEARGEILYLNQDALPKAWLIEKIKIFEDNADILRYMNSKDFDPEHEVLLQKGEEKTYSAEGSITLTKRTPNRLEFQVDLVEPQFAVFSEMYYPEGWTLHKGDEEIEILQSNYALRGAELPAGTYKLIMEFRPASYYAGVGIVWVADVLMIILILGSLVLANRDKIFPNKIIRRKAISEVDKNHENKEEK